MVVKKQAQIVVTAKTDQASQQFERLAESEERAADKLSLFIEKARAANDAARFSGFDKATEAAKRTGPAFNKATLGITAASNGLAQFSMGAGVGGVAAGALKTGIMAASAAAGPLGMLLAAGGIAAVDFAMGQREAAKATDEANRMMEKQLQIMRLAKEAKARELRELAYHERVNREYWADRQREVDARAEELKSIENTLAQHGRGKDMSALIAREAEIRADNAATMGRHEEAAQIRREEELRILKELGTEDQKRASSKREEAKWSAAIVNSMRMRKPLIEREGSDSRDFAAEMREAKAGDVRKSFADFRKQQLSDALQTEVRGQESMLEVKLQGIERERAAGVDPWSLAQREADARLFALQAQQNYIDQTMIGQERLIATEMIAAQKRQILHERELQGIAAMQRRRAEQRRQFEMIGGAIGRVHEGIAAAALRGAFAQGQSVKESVKQFAKGEAQEMGITAATETIRGLVAVASYNYPKATQHFTNAGLAGAQAVALGGVYGALGGGGSRSKNVAGVGGDAFGFGPSGGAGGGGGTTSPRSGSLGQGPPISRVGVAPPPRGPSGPKRDGGGDTFIFQSVFAPDSAQIMEARKLIKKSERDDGEVN